MRKISEALSALVEQNGFLRFGLHHRLLNLTQVARYLRPQIQARVKKDVEESAITMNLSRLQRGFGNERPADAENLRVSNIIVHSELCILAYPKKRGTHAGVNKLYTRVIRDNGYITITEGMNEVAIITEAKYLSLAESYIEEKPVFKQVAIASLGVKFDPSYLETPGLFYHIFEQLYFQRINIVEIASAGTELILYIAEEDVQLAFDTIYNKIRTGRHQGS